MSNFAHYYLIMRNCQPRITHFVELITLSVYHAR
nr:MAG TPA: hypothetical protein [Caudoviricetes sp.]